MITFGNDGTNTQLLQRDLMLPQAGTECTLQFDACSTGGSNDPGFGHNLGLKLIKNTSPFTNYGLKLSGAPPNPQVDLFSCSAGPFCGDGIVDLAAGEECEEGAVNTATCDSDCTFPECGDGLTNPDTVPSEECDDGNAAGGDGCDSNCQVEDENCDMAVCMLFDQLAATPRPGFCPVPEPCTVGDEFAQAACAEHRSARTQIEPPCDPRQPVTDDNYEYTDTPCGESTGNYLPTLPWDVQLADQAAAFAGTCPETGVVFLDGLSGGIERNIFHFPGSMGVPLPSDIELVELAVGRWVVVANQFHNPRSGFAYQEGLNYKNLVSGRTQQFGCGVATCDDVAGGRAVVSCYYGGGATPDGPSYPPLYFDAALQIQFRDGILASINAIRQSVTPEPASPLAPLVWNAQIASLARSSASLLEDDYVFRPELAQPGPPFGEPIGEILYRHPGILPNGGTAAASGWLESGALYDLAANTCAGEPPGTGICGEYTQIVDEEATSVGCWQDWYEGKTWVVCTFDHRLVDDRAHTDRPYVVP